MKSVVIKTNMLWKKEYWGVLYDEKKSIEEN